MMGSMPEHVNNVEDNTMPSHPHAGLMGPGFMGPNMMGAGMMGAGMMGPGMMGPGMMGPGMMGMGMPPMRPPHFDMHSTGGFRGHHFGPHHRHMHHAKMMHHMMHHHPEGMMPHHMRHGMPHHFMGERHHQGGKPILTYFDVAGLAEAIRMTFLIGGVDFEDRRITRDEWESRYKSYSPTKQCPILEVDGRVIVQSHAILQYAAARSYLMPRSEEKVMGALMIAGKMNDLKTKLEPIYYMPAGEEKVAAQKDAVINIIGPYFTDMEKFVASNQDGVMGGIYALGDMMSYADVMIADYLNQAKAKGYEIGMEGYPKLAMIHKNVMEHPAIIAYVKSRREVRPRLYSTPYYGKSHPARMAFAIGNIEFDDMHISLDDLKSLKEEHPTVTVPYMEVDNKIYTESIAILAYAAMRAGLMPCCAVDRAHAWSVVRTVESFYDSFQTNRKKYTGNAEVDRLMSEWAQKTGIPFVQKVEGLVAQYQDAEGHIVGQKVSFADLSVATMFFNMREVYMGPIFDLAGNQYPHMKRTYDMVFNISAVKNLNYGFRKTKPVLVYFDHTGRGESIRALMRLAKIDFEDRRIDRDAFEQSYKAVSPTGQVPYLEVDGEIIAETKAILTYVAERADMLPPTYLGRARAEMIFQTWDPIFVYLRDALHGLSGPERQNAIVDIRDNKIQSMLQAYEAILAPKQHSLGYLVDNQLTWVDVSVACEFKCLTHMGLVNDESAYPVLSKVTNLVMNKL